MSISKINSYAKINLSLGVLGKLKNKLHRIESLVSFIDLHDEISIQKINKKKHKVFFYGQFSKNISNNEEISHEESKRLEIELRKLGYID